MMDDGPNMYAPTKWDPEELSESTRSFFGFMWKFAPWNTEAEFAFKDWIQFTHGDDLKIEFPALGEITIMKSEKEKIFINWSCS